MTRALPLLSMCVVLAAGACGGGSSHHGEQASDGSVDVVTTSDGGTTTGPWTRDWAADPAVYVDSAPAALYAVSDVHGGDARLAKLLQAAHLASASGASAQWTGGTATLVVVGDSIDKGSGSIPVLDTWRTLEPQAKAAGGHLVVLLGNHEAEFLADPENKKAAALHDEIDALGDTPEHFASADSPYGRFLRRLPVAALVGGWFFSHAGSSSGQSVVQIATQFRQAADAGDWGGDFLVGGDSLLEANDWWSNGELTRDLSALSAEHIAMGHDPHAFNEEGKIKAHYAGRLVRLDTGLSPAVDYSKGLLLRVDGAGSSHEQAFTIDPSGKVSAVNMTAP